MSYVKEQARVEVKIRPATFDDLYDVARVHVTVWQQAYVGQVSQDHLDRMDVNARHERWKEKFQGTLSGYEKLYIACASDQVVGFVSFGSARDEDMAGNGEIYAVYALKDIWKKSVGYQLFKAAKQEFLAEGISTFYLWVLASNHRAIETYRRWGGEVLKEKTKDLRISDQILKEVMVKFCYSV